MKSVSLSGGTIEYEEAGITGPTVVLLHGLMMNASLWRAVIAELSRDHRCLAPVLPLGAHREPLHADANLTLPGQAQLVAEFMHRLDLQDVTLVGCDTGGAIVQLIISAGQVGRIGRVVLLGCEAFDNFPAGLTEKTLVLAGRFPAWMFGLAMQQMRLRPLRRLPVAFGWLTKRGDATTREWLQPVLTRPSIRRDAVRLLRSIGRSHDYLAEAAQALPAFDRPALVIWAVEDKVMPRDHGRRLTELFPQGRLAELDDSYTLLPLDRPSAVTDLIRSFTSPSSHGRPAEPPATKLWPSSAAGERTRHTTTPS